MHDLNRRQFVKRSTAASLTLAAASHARRDSVAADKPAKPVSKSGPKIAAFTKSFQDRPIPEVCRIFKSLGLDGLDLTVRPGGHIDPKDVEKKITTL